MKYENGNYVTTHDGSDFHFRGCLGYPDLPINSWTINKQIIKTKKEIRPGWNMTNYHTTTHIKSVSTPNSFDQLLSTVVPFIGENLTWENGIFRLTDCIDKIIFSFRNGQQNLKVKQIVDRLTTENDPTRYNGSFLSDVSFCRSSGKCVVVLRVNFMGGTLTNSFKRNCYIFFFFRKNRKKKVCFLFTNQFQSFYYFLIY